MSVRQYDRLRGAAWARLAKTMGIPIVGPAEFRAL